MERRGPEAELLQQYGEVLGRLGLGDEDDGGRRLRRRSVVVVVVVPHGLLPLPDPLHDADLASFGFAGLHVLELPEVRHGRFAAEVEDGFWRVAEEVVEVDFADVRRTEDVLLLEGIDGFGSEQRQTVAVSTME